MKVATQTARSARTVTINDNAYGATRALIGTVVTIAEQSASGRATRVMMQDGHPHYKRHGSWLPTRWLDGLDEEPEPCICPTSGQAVAAQSWSEAAPFPREGPADDHR